MTTTEFTTPRVQTAKPTEGLGGAGAAIYRRMERKQRRPAWLAAIPVGVVALFAVGGFFAYESMSKPAATAQPVASEVVDAQAPAPAATPIVTPTPAPVAAVPAPEAAAPTPVHHRAAVAKHVRARAATPAVRNTSATAASPAPVAAPPASSPTAIAPVSPTVVSPPTASSEAPVVSPPAEAPATTAPTPQ
ncbi:MAG TPA: hypothetical protein VIJ59_10500 [Caulobacteraceae bacterium]